MLPDVFHVLTQTRHLGRMACEAVVWKFVLTSLVHFWLAFFSGSSIFILCHVPGKCLLLCRSLKKNNNLVLDTSMTSTSGAHISHCQVHGETCLQISWSRLRPIARTPYSPRTEPEGVRGCNFNTFQSDSMLHRHFWNNCRCVLYGFFISFQYNSAPCSYSEAIEPWVNSDLVLWIKQFLCDRPQRVSLNFRLCSDPVFSEELALNTGSPGLRSFSSSLFHIHKRHFLQQSRPDSHYICKWHGLAGRLKDEFSLSQYYLQVELLNCCFRSSFLELNIAQTKELVLGGLKGRQTARPVSTDNQEVEIVNSFKYLGTLIDQNLTFCNHVDFVYKKAHQRLFLLRRLESSEVHQHILEMIYRGLVEDILSFNIVTWLGNITVKNKARLARIVNTVSKLIGRDQRQLSTCIMQRSKEKLLKYSVILIILVIQPLKCFRQGDVLKLSRQRKNIYKKYFIPSAIGFLSGSFK